MVTSPPRLAEWLVRHTTPPESRGALLGDLCEELYLRGDTSGHRWYWRQAQMSVVHWIPRSLLLLLPAYALPLWLLDRLWSFLLSSIPLKADLLRDWPMLAVNLLVACLLAAASRLPSGAILLMSAVLLVLNPASLPLDYCSLFLVLPALATQWPLQKAKFI